MVSAKVFIYAKPFTDMPSEENFELIKEDLPPLNDGEFLAEALYLSVDPYMRTYASYMTVGKTMEGAQVAKIIESKSTKFPVGKYVIGSFGWRTHTVVKENPPYNFYKPPPTLIPDDTSVPLSYYLGVLGMPGASAYFGFLDICKPKDGETVVVTGAAGAVGCHVGQIAKLRGCKVIGITGSDEKCRFLKTLGFDSVINYKKDNIANTLKKVAPKGIDCFFDNVGGEIATTVISQMNRFGRVSCCGVMSNCIKDFPEKVTTFLMDVVFKEIEMKGFIIYTFLDQWGKAEAYNMELLKTGKLQYKETVTEGFENIIQALIGMLNGDNIGKAIVKV